MWSIVNVGQPYIIYDTSLPTCCVVSSIITAGRNIFELTIMIQTHLPHFLNAEIKSADDDDRDDTETVPDADADSSEARDEL